MAGSGSGCLLEWQAAQVSAKTSRRDRPSRASCASSIACPPGASARRSARAVDEEEDRHVDRLALGRLPVDRVPLRIGDADRRDLLAAEEGAEVQQPLLAEQADVEVDAVERAERSDAVGAVLQHAHRRDLARCSRRRASASAAVASKSLELLVVELVALQRLAPDPRGLVEPGQDLVDRVHGARIVHVVGRDQRGVERARRIGVEELVEEVALVRRGRPGSLARLRVPEEDAVDPEILRAGVGGQLGPVRRSPTSSGGSIGFGPTWQKAQDMPTR